MNINQRLRLAREKFQAGLDAFEADQHPYAFHYFLEAAHLFKKLPREKIHYAQCLVNAATALYRLNYHTEAKKLLDEALTLQKEVLGPEHPEIAGNLDNLATIYQREGNYEKAKQLSERALSIREKTLGTEHPEVAANLNNLATVYQVQGNYEEAKQLYEKVLALREKTLGPEHLEVAMSLNNLANVYQTEGNHEKAKHFYEKSLTIFKKTLGYEPPEVTSKLETINDAYHRYEEAKRLHQRALTLFKEILGYEFPEVTEDNIENIQNYAQRHAILNRAISEMLSKTTEHLDRQEIERRIALEEAKKLSYLGNMATGVAHNINNPVGIIRLAAQRGLRGLKKERSLEEEQEIFQRILTQTDRLYKIIQNFRDFARGDRKHREMVALNALVEQTQGYFENQLEAHRITLKIDLSGENPISQANHFVLQEVLINLISNAREALEHTPDAFILIKTWQKATKVGLQVEDNGPGVSPEHQKNLFSPFHSTKAHGTGLGLHVAHKALAELGGILTYQDREPCGACFMIELPSANGAPL